MFALTPEEIQGGSDISGTLSMLHHRNKNNLFLNFFSQNHLSCLAKHK
jgi:hypothetical protein